MSPVVPADSGADAKFFVLDTNVLMHDPSALFKFQEHHVYLPMTVLEELDNAKLGVSEVARNVRQSNRFIDEILTAQKQVVIEEGLLLNQFIVAEEPYGCSGRLFFQTQAYDSKLPESLPGNKNDNSILNTIIALKDQIRDHEIVLISKDINLRIKATILGIKAEDYANDRVVDDLDLLFNGSKPLASDFWEAHGKQIESWQEEGKAFYEVEDLNGEEWYPNQFIYIEDEFEACVRKKNEQGFLIEVCQNYYGHRHSVWGITARNREQNFALNLLMDPEIDFVTMSGSAGTGKTLLALAAGLTQTLDQGLYKEIIMTRVTIPIGEDIGFLPGTEEEKMTPWMGALMDNMEVLTGSDQKDSWEQAATNDLLRNRIKIRSLNFMRGRTFQNKYIIIDEAQNLTSKQMKTLVTRSGIGTKIVCLGNLKQIDTPYLTETTSGMTYVVDRFKHWEHSGHITLMNVERSRLADYASDTL
ncbi:MAG: PhoH family protein [Gammaproteobacteria bacterium]|nr:PhoH family protein [Gammaproteobacteria bacterium]